MRGCGKYHKETTQGRRKKKSMNNQKTAKLSTYNQHKSMNELCQKRTNDKSYTEIHKSHSKLSHKNLTVDLNEKDNMSSCSPQ